MKRTIRLLAVLLALVLLAGMLPAYAEPSADPVPPESDGTFTYYVSDGQASLTGVVEGVKLSGSVTLPDSFRGLPVTHLSRHAIRYQDELTELIIPSSYQSISYGAIVDLDNLRRIEFPETIADFHPNSSTVLFRCPALECVYLHGKRSVLKLLLGLNARLYADVDPLSSTVRTDLSIYPLSELHYDVLTAEVQTEGEFSYVVSDGKATVVGAPTEGAVVVPDTLGGAPVCWLDPHLFGGAQVSSVTLPQTVEELSYCCFIHAALSSIDMPGVKTIGVESFAYCTDLKELPIGPACEELRAYAFANCSFSRMTLPEGLRTVGAYALAGDMDCERITLPSTLTALGEGAFCQTRTDRLTIPASLTVIPRSAFYLSLDGTLTLPDTLKEIGPYAFSLCIVRGTLDIPGSVEKIGDSAFAQVQTGRAVLHEGTRELGCSAFEDLSQYYGATEEFELILPEGLETIGEKALSTYLDELTVPGSVSSCEGAFDGGQISVVYGSCACVEAAALLAGLRYVDLNTGVEAPAPFEKTVGGLTYLMLSSGAILKDGSAASGALTVPETVEGRTVTAIADEAFRGNTALTSVRLPKSVTSIGKRAFENCSALTSAALDCGARRLRMNTFSRCTSLRTVTLPQTLTEIEKFAFNEDAALEGVTLPSTLRRIGESAFLNCESLRFVRLPDGLEQLGRDAFGGCTLLRWLRLPAGLSYQTLFGMSDDPHTLGTFAPLVTVLLYTEGSAAAEYLQQLTQYTTYRPFSLAIPAGGSYSETADGVLVTTTDGVCAINGTGVYRLDGDHATLTFCAVLSDEEVVVVADAVNGLPVTTVASGAFRFGDRVPSESYVQLGENVTTLEARVFFNLRGDLYIYLPAGAVHIDPNAFQGASRCFVYGYTGSAAERFAAEQGYFFYDIRPLPFTDVPEGSWYYDAVSFCYFNGLMNGASQTSFRPTMQVSRAQLAQVLYNMNGRPEPGEPYGFDDVPDGAWYADAVNWCRAQGLFYGVSDTSFAPDRALTREMLVTVFYRYARAAGLPCEESSNLYAFPDRDGVAGFAIDAMRWAVAAGIINGKPMAGTNVMQLMPQDTATRAEIAVILNRFVKYMAAREAE